jgi:hypothetical protein
MKLKSILCKSRIFRNSVLELAYFLNFIIDVINFIPMAWSDYRQTVSEQKARTNKIWADKA